jgi:hypothetical protein
MAFLLNRFDSYIRHYPMCQTLLGKGKTSAEEGAKIKLLSRKNIK